MLKHVNIQVQHSHEGREKRVSHEGRVRVNGGVLNKAKQSSPKVVK